MAFQSMEKTCSLYLKVDVLMTTLCPTEITGILSAELDMKNTVDMKFLQDQNSFAFVKFESPTGSR